MGAVTHATSDVRRAFDDAHSLLTLTGQRTILFFDEIHRFNRAQQDIFLPHVERGAVTLLGATTENPSFKMNAALLSRCRVFVMEKLSEQDLVRILRRAMKVWKKDRLGGMDGDEVGREQVEEACQEQIKEAGREQVKETGEKKVDTEGEAETDGTGGVKIEEAQVDEETKALHQLARISDGDGMSFLFLTVILVILHTNSHEKINGRSHSPPSPQYSRPGSRGPTRSGSAAIARSCQKRVSKVPLTLRSRG